MKALLRDIAQVWQNKLWFKLASLYILLLLILVIVLDWLPLPFTPNHLDLTNTNIDPFATSKLSSKHLAGTDALGRDVFVNTLYGARTGLFIALPVMLVSCLAGIVIGASAGYFGNNKLKYSIGHLLIIALLLAGFYFYAFYIPLQLITLELDVKHIISSLLVLALLVLLSKLVLLPLLLRFQVFRKEISFPLDKLVLRLIEILTSIPKLILILALASFITPSVTVLASILTLTYWTATARLARAEMLRIQQLPYIEAARSIGMKPANIIRKEALPNLLGPVVVAFTFGVAGLLAVESTLSFLGIGLPATTPSWGRLISGIRSDMSAWWLVVIPGTFLTLTVLAFQICSHYLLNSLQEKKYM
jgi:peptide/nickel transport system permease protein